MKFVVPPSGGMTPPEGGTTNCIFFSGNHLMVQDTWFDTNFLSV
ncbi:hypothetical protein QUF80_09205 [Desulfococcaceae bacterium HSG8]|nr:hypothetical protein [Desulfococcaceae bacterium HSG8]